METPIRFHIEPSESDGVAGYIIEHPTGERLFCYTLESALTYLASVLTGAAQLVMVL